MRIHRFFSPTPLCVTAVVLMIAGQAALLGVEFWPWSSGLGELVVWLVVLLSVGTVLILVAIALLAAWLQRDQLDERGWLKTSTSMFVLLPLINGIFFFWWPTAERLVNAAGRGEIEVVERCLFWGIDPDATYMRAAGFGGRGPTKPALHNAAASGHLEIVQLLLSAGADIDGNSHGALRAALHNGRPAVVQHLLQEGADPGGVIIEVLPESFGMQRSSVQALAALLEMRPDVVDSPWLLLAAAHRSHPDVARIVAGVDTDNRYGPVYALYRAVILNEQGRTPASAEETANGLPQPDTAQDRLAALRYLTFGNRAPADPRSMVNRETTLSAAARFGATQMVALLIRAGTPVDPPLDEHLALRAPLHEAVWNDRLETVTVLLEAGADITRSHRDLGTPLHAATVNASLEMLELLLLAGAPINAPRSEIFEETAIMTAIQMNNLDRVRLLVERGADLSPVDKIGFTACERARHESEVADFMATQDCGT